jgi:nucleoside-diphosphate-sugar epimerase
LKLRELQIDFQNGRAIVLGDGEDWMSLTTVQDLAKVVTAAVEYDGEWPEIGGVCGGQIAILELIRLGEEIRGECCPHVWTLCLVLVSANMVIS